MYFQWKILFFGFLIYVNLSNGQHVGGKPHLDPATRIARGIANMGRKLLTSLESDSTKNENLLISPTNIYHAMALLHMAASGNTLTEVSNLMGIPSNRNYSKSELHDVLSSFYKNITTTDNDPVILNIADAFFMREGFQIKTDYKNYVVKQYKAEIENLNFATGKGAPDKINHWVSEKTRGRIPKVVDNNLDPATEALIISTLYFNARWVNPFYKLDTKKDKFSTGEKEVDVQMMNLTERLPYVNNKELQFESIDLQYDGSDYAMNIILPYPNQTIKNLIPKLKDISINQIMEKYEYVGVNVKLPKTKFNVFKSLVKTFQQLGVNELFSSANLKDLTEASNFKVSEIQHGAEIEMHEEGTIASAVTVAHIVAVSLPAPIENPITFHVKRPFIINIYDTKNALNLFSGIVYNPEASS